MGPFRAWIFSGIHARVFSLVCGHYGNSGWLGYNVYRAWLCWAVLTRYLGTLITIYLHTSFRHGFRQQGVSRGGTS